MAQAQESWDKDEDEMDEGLSEPPFNVTVTKHIIDELRGLEVYQIKDLYPRTIMIPNISAWGRGISNIEVFNARTGKRFFCRMGTFPHP